MTGVVSGRRSVLPLPLRIGIALVVAGTGMWLLVRPLSAVTVLVLTAGIAGLLAPLALLGGPRGATRAALAGAALLAGAAILVLHVELLAELPRLAAIGLVVAGLVGVLLAVVRRAPASRIAVRALWLVAAALGAWLCLAWPDVAVVALGGVAGGALVVLAVAVLRARPRSGRGRTGRGRRILSGVSAVAVSAVVGAGLVGGAVLASEFPHADDFYRWEAALPDAPGAVLRVGTYAGETPDGAEALRILYSTTRADGGIALASAVVAIPAAEAGPEGRPVLAWQHGTTGVAQDCGPSVGDGALTEIGIPGISRMVERGWLVVAPDYPGQGTAGRYPYLVGEGEGRAVLDAVRAVQGLDGAGASVRTMLWGHSQGGHATLWAAQLAPRYAPELEVVSVAALSAAADPLALAERVTGADASALTALVTSYVLIPYADEYDDVRLADAVRPAARPLVAAMAGRCALAPTTLVSVLAAQAATAFDAEPVYRLDLASGPVRDRLVQNVASGEVGAPLFLGQGTADEVIPIEIQRELVARVCAAGGRLEAREYEGASHMGVIAPGQPLIDDLFAWFDGLGGPDGAEPASGC